MAEVDSRGFLPASSREPRAPAPRPDAWRLTERSSLALLSPLLVRFSSSVQGLTLVHFSAQLERLVWERGRA